MKSSKKKQFKIFDISKTYSIPMVKMGEKCHIDNEKRVEVKIEQSQKDGFVTIRKEGYQIKMFPDNQFDWYLWTGYIKEV